MKKAYSKPIVLMESFGITQMLSSCTLRIGFRDSDCVLNDENATFDMWDLAANGYFSAGACSWYPQNSDFEEGVCYHTSVNLAFSS